MRKLFIGALLAVLALALAMPASGALEQEYEQTFINKRGQPERGGSKSAGTNFHAAANDPEAAQPIPAREVDLAFPRGTGVNTKAATECTADDTDFTDRGVSACPSKSRIGTGSAQLKNNQGVTFNAKVTAMARRNGLILYIQEQSTGQVVILRPTLRRIGGVWHLITPVPPNCVLGTFDPTDNRCEFGEEPSTAGELTLTDFRLKTKPVSKRSGRRVLNFLTTPRGCPRNKRWVFTAVFEYGDRTEKELNSNSACRS